MQKNPVVFWELASHEMEKSVQFFRDVFDWEIDFNTRLDFYILPDCGPADERMDGGIFTLKKSQAALPDLIYSGKRY